MARDFSFDFSSAVLPWNFSSSSHRIRPNDEGLSDDSDEVIEDDGDTPYILLKPQPQKKWFAVKEIVGRQAGYGARRLSSVRFQHQYYGSPHAVKRFDLMHKLNKPAGCVSSVHFNPSGELMVCTSIDTGIDLWDWAANKSILKWDTGHTGEIFQAKFLPFNGDTQIITSALDGQVRLSGLQGKKKWECKETRLIAQHEPRTCFFGNNLAVHKDTPYVFLSAGEDSLVLSCDIRTSKATELVVVKEGLDKLELNYIHRNPISSNEFIVAGLNKYIRLYDTRKISDGITLNKFCPRSRISTDGGTIFISGAAFNYNGTEVIGSYCDDDCIYLFDTRKPPQSEYVHKYVGHLECSAIDFYGPRSEFIVCGSSCGNIFFWDKNLESIVQCLNADKSAGCLDLHPQVPLMVSAGHSSDIKIWLPLRGKRPSVAQLKNILFCNIFDRYHNRRLRRDVFYIKQLQRLRRQNQQRSLPDLQQLL